MEQHKTSSMAWFYFAAFVAIVVALVLGSQFIAHGGEDMARLMLGAALVTAGALGLIVLLAILPIGLHLLHLRRNSHRQQDELFSSLQDRLQNLSIVLNLVSEQQLLSDRAKAVAFREKDREAVRRAVQEEIARQDWEAALVLANDIEAHFGYKQEADRFRDEITNKRDDIHRRRLAEMMEPVDRHIKAEAWGTALAEAQQIMAMFPDDPYAQKLPQEIENRRQMRKQQLRDSWQEAVDRHDVDGSIEILKRLDLYLTPAEAESMQDIARNVFKEKRESLRLRFAQAVQEHRWQEAVQLGDEIMSDFPNTRIAQEVREKMDALRSRAEEPEAPAPA